MSGSLAPPCYPPAVRGRIVVWGLLAHAPFGGMTWQVLHHLVGLRQLGFDVWYVEDSDQRMLDLAIGNWVMSARENSEFARRYLAAVGLADQWIIRTPGSRECFGSRDWDGLLRLYSEADLVINLCGSHQLCAHHDGIGQLLYLETDPVLKQVALATGDEDTVEELQRYSTLATYATNLLGEDCLIPAAGQRWITTVPPVVIPFWATEAPPKSSALTTVMNWSSPENVVTWGDHDWSWSKRSAFRRIATLPRHSSVPLAIALRGAWDDILDEFTALGWLVSDAVHLDRPGAYRRFIRGSLGEVSVAKEQYTAPRSGWISDRTVCYLAAGRPAIVERSHISGIPLGSGLLDFDTIQEATDASHSVAANYAHHATAASELAHEHFAADKVMAALLRSAGLES